jgi:hypothetical protein
MNRIGGSGLLELKDEQDGLGRRLSAGLRYVVMQE